MRDLHVIDDPHVAQTVLEPIRRRVLAALTEPGSASTVADALDEPRQKVNYHVRALEELGLVELVEERPRRGLTERVVVASARSYLLAPDLVDGPPVAPASNDRLSSDYLLAVAARTIREVADLTRRARAARKSLATLTIDTEIRFAGAADRAAFTAELGEAVNDLVARYHDESALGGRRHRLVVAAHPTAHRPDRTATGED